MVIVPLAINYLINAVVSSRRIVKFLLLPTMDRKFLRWDHDPTTPAVAELDGVFAWATAPTEGSDSNVYIELPNGDTAKHHGTEGGGSRPSAFHFQVTVPRGRLVMVVGTVGSGKSTLIKAMIGDVPCLKGSASLHGRVAYVAQQAAVFNASLRNNILFGSPSSRSATTRCCMPAASSRTSPSSQTATGRRSDRRGLTSAAARSSASPSHGRCTRTRT
eukprot:TRINITY_DN16218_c0_g1_i1.p2 TRINITY_DN16218_c0_g1~~TRINITY_DN16218_c0_g1_i1.p2  ORF type:complete len:218 (-),score=31.80 TRINITY_DN16218_c0_g1_i1:357-1010(-)